MLNVDKVMEIYSPPLSSLCDASNTSIDKSAVPQSQSFSRRYGTILPTSLIDLILLGQRLLTLETCCGYGYGLDKIDLAQIFKDRQECT